MRVLLESLDSLELQEEPVLLAPLADLEPLALQDQRVNGAVRDHRDSLDFLDLPELPSWRGTG